ncbi:MAG: hypothetical protein ACLSVD_02540 [Eggerthellaceae bacterium]
MSAGMPALRALPSYEHFAKRMGDQRGWRLQYAYSEYVAACREGERPYAYSSFCAGLRGWRREMGAARIEWYPGEYMRTYWSRGRRRLPASRRRSRCSSQRWPTAAPRSYTGLTTWGPRAGWPVASGHSGRSAACRT